MTDMIDHIVGVEILFGGDTPTARYITNNDNRNPRLTTALIDYIIDGIDPNEIERNALHGLGLGDSPDIAARTLEQIRLALHAEIHGLDPSGGGSDSSGWVPA